MKKYQNILVAVDFIASDDNPVMERAREIARASGGQITLLHVIEPVYNYGLPWQLENNSEWQQELRTSVKNKLEELATHLKIPHERQLLEIGQPIETILDVAIQRKVDLIVVGSHGRHGLGLFLFGSTANSILKNAHCDVLAVYVGAQQAIEDQIKKEKENCH